MCLESCSQAGLVLVSECRALAQDMHGAELIGLDPVVLLHPSLSLVTCWGSLLSSRAPKFPPRVIH